MFSLIIDEKPSAPTCARLPNCVQFIDKDDARSLLLGLLKQIADTCRADADEHLDKFRSGDGKERNAGFAADGFGEQRLARSRRPHEKHSFWNSSAELLVLPRLLQEIDHFHQFGPGLINTSHVFKADLDVARLILNLGAALAERERSGSLTQLATAVTGDEHENQDRQHPGEQSSPPCGFRYIARESYMLGFKVSQQRSFVYAWKPLC